MSYVLNPRTNRMIRVGGKPWRSLVKDGIIANDPIAPGKPLFVGSTIEEAKAKKAELMEQVDISPSNKQDVIPTRKLRPNHFPARRGKKVVEVAKTPRQEEIAQYTAQCASRTLHKHIDALSDNLEDAYDDAELDPSALRDFEENLKNLILEEMISGNANKAPTRDLNKTLDARIKQKQAKQYIDSKFDPNYAETDYECDEYTEDDME